MTKPDIPTEPTTRCVHVFHHQETRRWTDYSGNYNTGFYRVDRYYCEKCLHVEEKTQTAHTRDTPDWYRE